jgi:DNA-binding Xre family transcriptional regulator
MPYAPCPMPNIDSTKKLQDLMQRVGVSSFKALSRAAGVSERQILRLRQGKLEQMRVDVLLKLSAVLEISLSELIENFSSVELLQVEGGRRQEAGGRRSKLVGVESPTDLEPLNGSERGGLKPKTLWYGLLQRAVFLLPPALCLLPSSIKQFLLKNCYKKLPI